MQLDKKTIRNILLLVFISLVMLIALLNLGNIFSFFGWVLGVLSPLLVGICMAFVVDLPMSFLERKFLSRLEKSKKKLVRGLRRPLALTLSYLLFFGILSLLLLIIIPELASAFFNLAKQLPGYADDLFNALKGWAESLNLPFQSIFQDQLPWNTLFTNLSSALESGTTGVLSFATDFGSALFSGLTSVFMGFIISIYLLLQKEKLLAQVRMALSAFLPKKAYDAVLRFSHLIFTAFAGFLTGQLIEAMLIAVLCFLGMLLLGIPFAGPVSALICVTALVPMIGPIVGTCIGAFLILLAEPLDALIFLIFIIVLQQIDGNLIYPKIVGKNVGLSPLLVITAVIVGTAAGGIVGILIAIPLFSVLHTLFQELVAKRLEKKGVPEGYKVNPPEDSKKN